MLLVTRATLILGLLVAGLLGLLLVAVQRQPDGADWFAAYADLSAGRRLERPCPLVDVPFQYARDALYCSMTLKDVAVIYVTTDYQRVIEHVAYSPTALRVGDLVRAWGMPALRPRRGRWLFCWPGRGYAYCSGSAARFSLYRRVDYVSVYAGARCA